MNLLKVQLPSRFGRKKPVNKPINDRFDLLRYYCEPPTRAQADLFQLNTKEMICADPARIKQIEVIVFDVANRIKATGTVVITDPSTYGVRDGQVEILRDGMARLESIQPTAFTTAETHARAEARRKAQDKAIEADASNFRKFLNLSKPVLRVEPPRDALVYNMEEPDADPVSVNSTLILSEANDFSTCHQVKRHLQYLGVATHPDLWIKCWDTAKQQHTPSGLFWEYLPVDGDIHGKHLEFLNWGLRAYIIALKFMQKEMTESPQPLDIVPGGNPCCIPKCENMGAHLHTLGHNHWPIHVVVHAKKIHNGADVLTENFDRNLFDQHTNNLVVKLKPRDASFPSDLIALDSQVI